MTMKFSDDVYRTLCIPLWCRGKAGERFPEVLIDRQAGRLIQELDYNFYAIEQEFGEYAQICCLARARLMGEAIQRFLADYPHGVIVNLGAGLDTTFSRVVNFRLSFRPISKTTWAMNYFLSSAG